MLGFEYISLFVFEQWRRESFHPNFPSHFLSFLSPSLPLVLSLTIVNGMTTRYGALEETLSQISDQLQTHSNTISKFEYTLTMVT